MLAVLQEEKFQKKKVSFPLAFFYHLLERISG